MAGAAHTGFIVAAYAVAGGVVFGLTAWVMLDYRIQLGRLADLEKRGITRRPAPRSEPPGEDVQEAKERA
jgi:heme exporter protein D